MVQEDVGQPKLDEDYQPVGGLHCNKSEEVDVVPDCDWDVKHLFSGEVLTAELYLLWTFFRKKSTRISFFSS